jgi:hypothetical protein
MPRLRHLLALFVVAALAVMLPAAAGAAVKKRKPALTVTSLTSHAGGSVRAGRGLECAWPDATHAG